MSLFSPLALPSGAVIHNRIAKAAMEENMADADHRPRPRCWSCTSAGPTAVPG